MKRRIKNRHIRHSGKRLLHRVDAHQVCRVMQRCQGDTLPDALDDIFRNDHRGGKFLSAVNHTMAHSRQLGEAFQRAGCRIQQKIQYKANGLRMIRNRSLHQFCVRPRLAVLDTGTLNPNALDQSL